MPNHNKAGPVSSTPVTRENARVTKQLLVRIGVLGCVRPFAVPGNTEYPRLAKVICQTERGVEMGEVLATVEMPAGQQAGNVVRALVPADDAHLAILRVRRDSAFRSCQQDLKRSRLSGAILIDAEPLFDGNSLYFYFADQVPPQSESLRLRLARAFHTQVYFWPIARQRGSDVEGDGNGGSDVCEECGCHVTGCGDPGCGDASCKDAGCGDESKSGSNTVGSAMHTTAHRRGCGSASDCAVCAVAESCRKRRRLHPDSPSTGSTAR